MGEKHDCVKFMYFNVLNIAALGRKSGPERGVRETLAGFQPGLEPKLGRCVNSLFSCSLPRSGPESGMVTSIHTD